MLAGQTRGQADGRLQIRLCETYRRRYIGAAVWCTLPAPTRGSTVASPQKRSCCGEQLLYLVEQWRCQPPCVHVLCLRPASLHDTSVS